MKKWFAIYRPYMVRPILYKSVFRSAVALALLLLWNRYVALAGRTGLSLVRDGCLTVGIIFLGLAWFSYLHLDGVKPGLPKREKKKKKPRRGNSDIVDFADEHIVSFDELGEDERIVCSLTANLVCGMLYLVVSVVGMVLYI